MIYHSPGGRIGQRFHILLNCIGPCWNAAISGWNGSLPGNDSWQVFHTYASLSPISVIWWWCSAAGKVSVVLVESNSSLVYCWVYDYVTCSLSGIISGPCASTPSMGLPLKVKGKGHGTCYSASYMSTWPEVFTISEVAADWHKLMIPQCTMRPSIARVSEQFYLWFAASRHNTASISHIRPSPRSP